MSSPPGVKIPVGVKDETKAGAQSIKKNLTSTFGDIAKTAAGFLARDLTRSLLRAGRETIDLAVKTESLRRSFNALRVSTGNYQSNIESLKEATSGAISETELYGAANQFMSLRLPTGKMEEMWAAAIKVGRAMGMTATQSIKDFNVAVGRASPLILDNFGLTLKMAEAQEIYAQKLGKSVDQLTESEKKMAFQAAAIQKLAERAEELGDATGDTITTFDRFDAQLTDIKTSIGQALLPTITAIMGAMSNWMTGLSGVINALKTLSRTSREAADAQRDLESAQEALTSSQAEARLRANELESAEEAVELAYERRNSLMEERRKAIEAVTAAETDLKDAAKTHESALLDLGNAIAFAKGEIDEYERSTEEATFSSTGARIAFDELSMTIQDLSADYRTALADVRALSGEFDENSDAIRQNRFEINTIRDAIADRKDETVDLIKVLEDEKKVLDEQVAAATGPVNNRITNRIADIETEVAALEALGKANEAEARQLRELESANRDLSLQNDELTIKIDDNTEALEAQQGVIEENEKRLEALKEADDAVEEAMGSLTDRTGELETAQESLTEATDAYSESVTEIVRKQVLRADAHDASARAIRREERALWQLQAAQDAQEAIRLHDEAQAALQLMGVQPVLEGDIPGMAEGGIVRKPTLAIIGEEGPEAVIPLSESSRFQQDIKKIITPDRDIELGVPETFPDKPEAVRPDPILSIHPRSIMATEPRDLLSPGEPGTPGLPGISLEQRRPGGGVAETTAGPTIIRIESLIQAEQVILDPENIDEYMELMMLRFSDLLHNKGIRMVPV